MDAKDKKIVIEDEDGKSYERDILFTYKSESSGLKYVFFFDGSSDDDEVQVLRFEDDGTLADVETDEEFKELEEVFNAYLEEQDTN
ncbi:MAG: DUF1292 domain-containing protein [Bacilli bacterium]|jgi:uncharacterized protein YrzB (UPF0473 family)